MSSLSDQLKAIGNKNQSVALDRKSRSKIHSRSLIYDAKTAATQDYDFIFSVAQEGFDELCELDSRFSKFRSTLFSETSINLDRNVQEREVVEMLNKNIDAFLALVAPYYQLAPALKAVEWLVRRFYANIHNSELLLTSCLPFYDQPVFVKVLNVVPPNAFPKIYEWVVGYKNLLKCPTKSSLIKAFSDPHFFHFYTMYIIEQSKHRNTFKDQLVLYLTNSVQTMAMYSKQPEKLTYEFVPKILESVAQLLIGTKDEKLTAYSIISVLSCVIPLSQMTTETLIETILANIVSGLHRQAMTVIAQLFNGQIDDSCAITGKIPLNYVLEYIPTLIKDGVKVQNFLVSYLLNTGNYQVFQFIDLTNKQNFSKIVKFALTNAGKSAEIPSICEKLYKFNKSLFVEIMESFKKGFKLSDLELILMTSLDETKDTIQDTEMADSDENLGVETMETDFIKDLEKSNIQSFFHQDKLEFFTILKTLLQGLSGQKISIPQFSKIVFPSPESSLSFFLRVTLTPSVPLVVRLSCLRYIKRRLKEIKGEFYLLTPIIILGLFDVNQSIRMAFAEILQVVRNAKINSKDLFMETTIYGEIEASKKALISPADGHVLLELLDDLSNVLVDRNQLPVLIDSIFSNQKKLKKKLGQVFKTFIYTQWALPLALPFKYPAWNLAKEGKFFANDIEWLVSSSNKRQLALEVKIPFPEIEKAIVSLVDDIDWLLKALYKDLDQSIIVDRIVTIFPTLKSENKIKVMVKFIEIVSSDEDDNLTADPLATLQVLPLDLDVVIGLLKNVQISSTVPEQQVAKRRRRSSSATRTAMARDDINNMASLLLKKLTVVLDLLESSLRKSPSGLCQPELLQSLFRSLTDLEYLGNDGNLPVLYAQETLASCMSLAISQMKDVKLDSNSIRPDLIVNSIRSSPSPQVQNRLLLVIAELASLSPEIILHSVMPIFTFMGAHTIRQDDEFSNLVLQETVASVVPALATDSTEIEFLLASFCAALPHIPLHRRVTLFVTLSKTLKPENSLSVILFLMGQQYSSSLNKNKNHECRSIVEFITAVLQSFTALDQLNAFAKYYQLWSQITDDMPQEISSRPLFSNVNINVKSDLLNFVNSIFQQEGSPSDESLKMKIALDLFESREELLTPFRDIISFILTELETHSEGSKISNQLYKLLNATLDILPLKYFGKSIIQPINDSVSGIPLQINVAKNLSVLASHKIDSELNVNNIDEDIKSVILDQFFPVIVENINLNINSSLQQSLLDTFASIINKFGFSIGDKSKNIIESLKIITSDKGLLNENIEVIIASINVITSIVNVFGVKVIGYFPKIVPPVLNIWSQANGNGEAQDDELQYLQTSILILFSCFVKKMPAFLVSSLDKVLITTITSDSVESSIRSNLLHVIVEHVDHVQLIKSLCSIWKEMSANNKAENIGLYLNTMQLTIDQMEKKAAISQSTIFMKWLLTAFEFNHYNESKDVNSRFDINTVRRLESSFHSCAISFTMKLNDKTFRPLFAGLVRWSINGEGSSKPIDKVERLTAFFKFFNKLQENLKGIITSYYSYIIDSVSQLLIEFSNNTLVDTNLRRIILNSLTSSFKYDQDDFWSQQSRFDTIKDPLLNQLYNIEDSIGKYIVKSITSFAVNVSSDEHNEKVVHGLIKFISNDDESGKITTQSKLWAVRVLRQIFQKMGEQWLSYLPTLIPYIAELLEDDDELVEGEVRRGLVKVIEKVLGEPLDRYLD